MTTTSECNVLTTAPDAEEFVRFLELQALLQQPGPSPTPFPLQEYQRLLVKYGVFTIDAATVGPPDPARTPRAIAILNTDCKAIPGDKPLSCPRSQPRLPPEFLPALEQRCRALGLIGAGETVLWVGRGAEMEMLCRWDQGCSCFGPAERVARWGRAAAALITAVGQILQETPARAELVRALAQVRSLVRVLEPLGALTKSDLDPEFPPRELVVAWIGLSEALQILEKQLATAELTTTKAEPIGLSWTRLVSATEAFRAAAGSVGPGLPATSVSVLARNEHGEPSKSCVARDGSAIRGLMFEPGAFVYGNRRHKLSGKPLQVLEALATARDQVLTLAALRDRCWGDAEIGEETIRSAIKTARAAVRRAIQAVGVTCPRGFDPIPIVDRGRGRTAWRLQLP